MGVEGVFSVLEEKEVQTHPVDMALVNRVDVDVLGIYFSYIRASHQWMTYAAYQKSTLPVPKDISNETILSRLVAKVHNKLLEYFSPSPDIVLHIDGKSTVQKARGRESRAERRRKNMDELNDLYEKIQVIVHESNSEPLRRCLKRKLLWLYRKSRNSWASARVIDSTTKKALLDGLKELGWEVCSCTGEADVCIGRKTRMYPGEVVAASADSDLLFHQPKSLLRRDYRSRTFTEYRLEELMHDLNVNEAQWVVAGLVTNNDYSGHVRGQSFKKILAMVSECKSMTAESVLEEYCSKMNVASSMFQPSKDIFIFKSEDLVSESQSNETIDSKMKELVNIVSRCLQQ
jgi:hypothetical protein